MISFSFDTDKDLSDFLEIFTIYHVDLNMKKQNE